VEYSPTSVFQARKTRRLLSFRRASACTSAPILRKATLDNNTDSSRRRFLAITAAASAVGAGSLAVAATPTTAHQCFAADDSELPQLEKQIFEQLEAAQAYDDEIFRLSEIWEAKLSRLENEFYAGRSALTTMERWAIIKAMPESAEHERLTKLQRPYYDAYDTLIERMFFVPAQTAEGRRSKVAVLLSCIWAKICLATTKTRTILFGPPEIF
jgi:hypothetical protein